MPGSDAFWSAEQLNAVEIADRDACIDAVGYVLANPVAAGLVEHGRDWPGVRSRPLPRRHVAAPPPPLRSLPPAAVGLSAPLLLVASAQVVASPCAYRTFAARFRCVTRGPGRPRCRRRRFGPMVAAE